MKKDLRCTDGRTNQNGRTIQSDRSTSPLVWEHMYNDPSNVLGHAVLENRPDGVSFKLVPVKELADVADIFKEKEEKVNEV